MTEAKAKEMILEAFGAPQPTVSAENKGDIMQALRQLAEKGLSIRQLSRFTGISKGRIEQALR